MKKSRLVYIVLGIVALLGLTSRVGDMPQETKIERQKLTYGYLIKQTKPFKRTFGYDSNANLEWLEDNDNNILYVDNDCNGVDRIHTIGWYRRGDNGKEEMFKRADKYFEKAKKEMGANDIK